MVAAGRTTAAGSEAAKQLLDALLSEAGQHVRMPAEVELANLANSKLLDVELLFCELDADSSPGEAERLTAHAHEEEERSTALALEEAQARMAAEALLLVAERVNSADVRRRAGEHWSALLWELDERISTVCGLSGVQGTCPGADALDELEELEEELIGSFGMRDKLKGRPSATAIEVASSLGVMGPGSLLRDLSQMHKQHVEAMADLAALQLDGPQQEEGVDNDGSSTEITSWAPAQVVEPVPQELFLPSASTLRPQLASRLSRFDASWRPEAEGHHAAGSAVAEARCEVTVEATVPVICSFAAADNMLAFIGPMDPEEDDLTLTVGCISSGSGLSLADVPAGLEGKNWSVAADPARGWVWAWDGQSIKAVDVDGGSSGTCRHTLASGAGKLLAVMGGRVLSAQPGGSLDYWDIGRLMGPGGEAVLGEHNTNEHKLQRGKKTSTMPSRSADGSAVHGAEQPHGSIQLLDPQFAGDRKVLHLLPLGEADDTLPQQVVATVEHSASLFLFDWQDPAPRLHTMLAGHIGNVTAASTCAALPHTLASGSDDGMVRVWDLRSAACTHLLTSKTGGSVSAVALVADQGAPFCFYSTFGGESILCFDLRTRRCLYELATGNTCVHSLQWHAPSRSLFAATNLLHRWEEEEGAMGGYCWPKAQHCPWEFSHAWDAGKPVLIRYQFKDAPDLSVLPPEAQLDSETEEGAEAEQRKEWRSRAATAAC